MVDNRPQDARRGFASEALPEEVLLMILHQLDSEPLSTLHSRMLPTDYMFEANEDAAVKAFSVVCKRWRRIAVPLLFKHIRFQLDDFICTVPPERAQFAFSRPGGRGHDQQAFFHVVECMIADLSMLGVVDCVNSFLLTFIDGNLDADYHSYVGETIDIFWDYILRTLNPRRLILLSSFHGLAALTGVVSSNFVNDAVRQHHLNVLELDVKSDSLIITNDRETSDHGIATKSPTDFRFKPSSLFYMRSWSHIGLNEGNLSDLDEQYEYDGPVTMSLLPYLFPPCCVQHETAHSHRWAHLRDNMTFLDHFSYTGIMIPAGHIPNNRDVAGVHPFHYLRKLSIKLLPDRREMIDLLDDPEDDEELKDRTYEHAYDVNENYANLRIDMLNYCTDPTWRLRTLVSDDYYAYAQSQALVREFATEIHARMEHSGDEDWWDRGFILDWGRLWEMKEVERQGERQMNIVVTGKTGWTLVDDDTDDSMGEDEGEDGGDRTMGAGAEADLEEWRTRIIERTWAEIMQGDDRFIDEL
ncbi:26S protease regulatory subunit 8 [Sphaceloma murrayae]|uniref:26S protease regulatory subunit 8 n=1 Tax=Sphaceloma murrayae TaxID=2082308 RepID=A0A2K1QVJ9_9PEZI|nr:26S protease regulatory subunit 8 [Sphaceloma murrayae]